jgi:hypothetical protein
MAAKKACVLYGSEQEVAAEAAAERLRKDGYEVCASEVTAEEARTVRAGDLTSLPPQVSECLKGAELCLILLAERNPSADLGPLAGLASDAGARVVTLGGSPEELPTELDDVIDGHVPSVDAPRFDEVVCGVPERLRPDNTTVPRRDEDRVKCQ